MSIRYCVGESEGSTSESLQSGHVSVSPQNSSPHFSQVEKTFDHCSYVIIPISYILSAHDAFGGKIKGTGSRRCLRKGLSSSFGLDQVLLDKKLPDRFLAVTDCYGVFVVCPEVYRVDKGPDVHVELGRVVGGDVHKVLQSFLLH